MVEVLMSVGVMTVGVMSVGEITRSYDCRSNETTPNMCKWPDLQYGDLYSYLIESPCTIPFFF